MGWTEVVAGWVRRWVGNDVAVSGSACRDLRTRLIAMPPADRIALARELLAAVGYRAVAVPDEWDIPGEFGEGWNACRRATLSDDTDREGNA